MDVDGHKLAVELQKQSQWMVDDNPRFESEVEEFDFKQVIERILGKEDWTDKLASGLGKLRSLIRRPQHDTPLPEDLRQLIPDMKEVEMAYVEMTQGYKDFIKMVWEAQHQRQWRE